MCVHCEKKQLHAVNELLDVLSDGKSVNARIASVSTAKSWDSKPPQTPYLDYAKLLKRAKKNTKKVSGVFKTWKTRFNEKYKAATGSIFLFHKQDLTIEAWEELVTIGITSSDELYQLLISITGDELLTSANEILENLFKLKSFIVDGVNEPPKDVMDFLEKYEFRLSESTQRMVDERLKNIVVNGIANGEGSPEIARNIRNTFDNLSKDRALLIARTETIRASSEGAKTAYLRAGIQQIAILPAVDACPICMEKASDNPYDVKDSAAYSPYHPNCRCTIVPVFDETDVQAISVGVVDANSF